jgi:hypothetical protein
MKTNLFKLVFVMLLGITVLVSSCGKDDKKDEVPETPAEIILSAPADNATFDMAAAENEAGITFTWVKDAKVTDYLLKVSVEQSFATTVASVSGNQDSYLWTSTEIETKLQELSVDYEQSQTFYWTVTSARSDQQATTKTRSFTVTRKQHPPKYGEWLFDDPANLGKAALGNDLELKWGESDVTKAEMFESVAGVDGDGGDDKALRIGYFGWLLANHGLKPIGADSRINTYSVLWDVNFRTSGNAVYGWMTTYVNHSSPLDHPNGNLICLALETPNDAGTGGKISGVSNMWSATSSDDLEDYYLPSNQWKRVVFRINLVDQIMETFVDGVLVAKTIEANKTRLIPNDCIWAWYPEGVVFFPPIASGGFQQEKKVDVSRIAIWDYCLTPEEIAALGAAGASTDIGED